MTLASDPAMDFARAMDYTIDKDEFWQLSTASASSTGAGASMDGHQHRDPSDFFDQYVVMDGAEATHSPGESFLVPLHEGGGGMSPPASASSVANGLTSTGAPSHAESMGISCTTLAPPAERSTRSGSLTTSVQHRQSACQAGGIAAADSRGSTNHVVLGHLDPETLEQRRRLLSGRRGQDQPVGGSISDSELLKLEGLSVKSPRGLMARAGATSSTSISTSTPSTSPPLADDLPPPSTLNTSRSELVNTSEDIDLCDLAKNGQHTNFKAGSRRFESIYSTIRSTVGGHSRQPIQQQQQPQPQQQQQQQQQQRQQQQQPQTSSSSSSYTSLPSHMESLKKATRRMASEGQLMWDGLPISPPLTGMAQQQQSGTDTAFVTGLMDDPFFDSHSFQSHDGALGHAAHLNGKAAAFNANIPNTPLHTPNLRTDTATDDAGQYFPTTTGAEQWSLGGTTFVTSVDMPNTTAFLPDNSGLVDGWNFGDPSPDSGGNNLDFVSPSDGHSNTGPRNHHNLTIQVPPYAIVHDGHHTPGSETDHFGSTNGLMIHMPQPRTPSTAPLLSSQIHHQTTNNGMGIPESASMYSFHTTAEGTTPHHHHQQHHMAAFRGAYTDHSSSSSRRHKPRAPSSGARYHQNLTGANISPRKVRQPSSSSSSPSPTPHHTPLGTGRRSRSMSRRQGSVCGVLSSSSNNNNNIVINNLHHRKSTTDLPQHGGIVIPSSDTNSHAIRKRRSISSWRGSSSGSGGIMGGSMSSSSSSRRTGSGGSSACEISLGGAEIGFVNYTPDDHNVLMTGVAPSGSSKTKARREKEAMERQRKLSEAVVKAVTAAGVDVARLKEEGIMI